MFGIWRGYDPAGWPASTFIEVHQGAVRGLNDLLPAMGLATIVLTVFLAYLAKGRPQSFWLFGLAAIAAIASGLITRFGNQPINTQIMSWSTDSIPENWASLRDQWWQWHLARLAFGLTAEVLLIVAILAGRDA